MGDIDELENIILTIDEKLDDKDTVRELLMKSSRTIERISRQIIQLIHNDGDPRDKFNDALQEVSKVKSIVEDYPELYHSGMLRNGFQELAEAHILWSIKNDREILGPRDLNITPDSYLLGLGDVVGELRRMILDSLAEDELEKARSLLTDMERIKDLLLHFDYPNAVLPIRHKQDVARDLVEKTRGDVTRSITNSALRKKMDELLEKL